MSFISTSSNLLVWLNGEFLSWGEAKTHVMSHGLNNASCVFEGERVYNKKTFLLNDHIERFFKSASIMKMQIDASIDELIYAHEELILKQSLSNAYVRPIAWIDDESVGILSKTQHARIAIVMIPWMDFFKEKHEFGVSLKSASWRRPPPEASPYQAKASCHYVIGRLGQMEARSFGYDDALLRDYRGYIAETPGANIFFVKDEAIFTPIADCFLGGITRKTVIEIAKVNNIPVYEKHITLEELLEADEVFLTGTAYEILPVFRIDDINFSIKRKITNKIKKSFFELTSAGT